MRDLNYDLKKLGERNPMPGRSQAARANRARILSLIANELFELGYRKMRADDLKGRHVNALIAHWRHKGLAVGTIKNRMAALRWWAAMKGRASVIAKDNLHYGIENRVYVTNASKARRLSQEALLKVKDPFVRMSLELQREFGLRREEAMKFQPKYADRGDKIVLKPSWAKGKRAREVPVRTQGQRAVLDRAHKLAGSGSLIPRDRMYSQHLKVYERHTITAGLNKMHGLRHAYAQRRYEDLTGRVPPALGGKVSKDLTPKEKAQDREVRLGISAELGHEREQVTAVYLGR